MSAMKPRCTIILDEELMQEIEDFRFDNRYPSRSAAALELLRIGLKTIKQEQTKKSQNS